VGQPRLLDSDESPHPETKKRSPCSSASRRRSQRSVSTASGESFLSLSGDESEMEVDTRTDSRRVPLPGLAAICFGQAGNSFIDAEFLHETLDASPCSSSSSSDGSKDESELSDPPLPKLPCVRRGRSGGVERRLKTAPLCCEVPRVPRCVGCLISLTELMCDPDSKNNRHSDCNGQRQTQNEDNCKRNTGTTKKLGMAILEWENNRHSSSHSATGETEDLSNKRGTNPPQPHDVIGGFGKCRGAEGSARASADVARTPIPSEQMQRLMTPIQLSANKHQNTIPSEQQQQQRKQQQQLQQHQGREGRHSGHGKLSKSTLAAGVASALGHAGQATDAVLAVLGPVQSRSHKMAPVQAFYCEDSRDGASPLEENASNSSSSEGKQEMGKRKTHQDPGQTRAAWLHERSHSAMVEQPPPLEARSSLTPDSPGCSDVGSDAAAAISKAGRQEFVQGNHYDSISPRSASMISSRSKTLGRSARDRKAWQVGVGQEVQEEFTNVGRQTPGTPRSSSCLGHRRPHMPVRKVSQEGECMTPVREIKVPRSSPASQRYSAEPSMGPKQDPKQAAAISAKLSADFGLSPIGRPTFPKLRAPRGLVG